MVFLHFISTWKPTISNFGVNRVNEKKMGYKQKDNQQKKGMAQHLVPFLVSLILLFGIPNMIPIKSNLRMTLCC